LAQNSNRRTSNLSQESTALSINEHNHGPEIAIPGSMLLLAFILSKTKRPLGGTLAAFDCFQFF
jgi:hypothetical protein